MVSDNYCEVDNSYVCYSMQLLYTCNIVSMDPYHAPYLKSHSFYYA